MLIINKKYKAVLNAAKNEIARRNKENEFMFYAWCKALELKKNSTDKKTLRRYMFDDIKQNIKFK